MCGSLGDHGSSVQHSHILGFGDCVDGAGGSGTAGEAGLCWGDGSSHNPSIDTTQMREMPTGSAFRCGEANSIRLVCRNFRENQKLGTIQDNKRKAEFRRGRG